jgi:hypothetical protein
MSAYSASAPVIARKTDPSVSSDPNRCSAKNAYACHGFSAERMPGFFTIGGSPRTAMIRNHAIMIGPKILPMPPVPRFWTRNSPIRITTVIGTM